jgi:hypothetical protein
MMMMGSPRKVASLIVAKKLGGSIDRASQLRGESEEMLEQMNPAEDEGKVALVEAAQKLVAGMESKSPELIAKAFHTMFRLVEMMPHEEYHEEIEEAVEGY